MDEHSLRVIEYHRIREILCSYAVTPPGRRMALDLRPFPLDTRDHVDVLERAIRETSEMRLLLESGGRLPLGGVGDVASEIEGMAGSGAPMEPEALRRVVMLLEAARALRERMQSLPPEDYSSLQAMGEGIEDLPEVREEIILRVDPRGKVRGDASPALQDLRSRIEARRTALRQRVQSLAKSRRWARYLQSPDVSLRNDRFVLSVRAEERREIAGVVHDRSQSGATVYIEPEEVLVEGNELVDWMEEERREVRRILWELSRSVLAVRDRIRGIQERIGHVDLTAAKAAYAEAFRMSRPELSPGTDLVLRRARHPYLWWLARHREASEGPANRKVVPIDVELGRGFRILIVTGPNTGGKTVALKTVGLTVAMALSGMHIPAAQGSRVPCYLDLFVDIGDEQSIEQSLSTFSSHLVRIIDLLDRAGPRTLVLLDELGAGTDPLEGAALGTALLDRLLHRGVPTIITTHIGSLKEYAYSHSGAENAAMEFDPGTLRPTYRMVTGIPGASNALQIAGRLGMPADVIRGAEAVLARDPASSSERREIVKQMQDSRRAVEAEKRRMERDRRDLRALRRAAKERLGTLERERATLEREADHEIEERIRRIRDDLAATVRKLRNVPKGLQPFVAEMEEKLALMMTKTPVGERRDAFARRLKKDDEVYVPRFGERCRVTKINKSRRFLVVLVRNIPVEVSFDDVSWVDAPPEATS